MFLIKADISLTNENRKPPIKGDSYRPLLYLPNNVIRSGLIFIDKNEVLEMTESYSNRLIGIYFYKDLDIDKIFKLGAVFNLVEGSKIIGIGKITEVIGVTY